MRFTIQYIPLNKIQSGGTVRITEHIKQLRGILWESHHLLAVKKNRKGSFTLVGGHDRLKYLRLYTNRKVAPCIMDERKDPSWIRHLRPRALKESLPKIDPEKMTSAAWSIIRSFLKQEPRFARLSRYQQAKVLLLGVRYKKTVLHAMKAMTDEMAGPKATK